MVNNNEQPAPALSSSEDATPTRNVRSFTRGIKLDLLIAANKGKLSVNFSELDGEPDCKNTSPLASECGIIVRSLAPLRYMSWMKIPSRERDALIERLKNKFILDTSLPMVKDFLMKSMGSKYSNRRNKMSIHFQTSLKSGTYEEAKRKPYEDVSLEDWDWLCDHVFSSETFKKRSAAGAKAREAVPFNHCGGSKSHVVHRAEKRKAGVEQGDIQTFHDTHSSTNKETGEVVWISDEARIKWVAMNEEMQRGSEAGATPPTEAEVCAKVLKKKQRRRRSVTTVSNNEGIQEMLQAQADRIQAQEEQIRAQNEVIKKMKEDNEKVLRNMQDMMIRSLGLNNSSLGLNIGAANGTQQH